MTWGNLLEGKAHPERIPSPSRKQISKVKQSRRRPNVASVSRVIADTVMTVAGLRSAVPDPFPQMALKKLHWSLQYKVTAPATNLTLEQIYSLNSAYDPPQLGAGDIQPNYWDTLALLYSFYQVRSVECEITFFDPNQDGLICGYQLQGTSISAISPGDAMSRPLTQYATISNTGQQTYTFRLRLPIWEVLGIMRSQYVNDTSTFGAQTNAPSANPNTQAYIRLFAVSTQAGVATDVKILLKFNYEIQFWNRPSFAISTV